MEARDSARAGGQKTGAAGASASAAAQGPSQSTGSGEGPAGTVGGEVNRARQATSNGRGGARPRPPGDETNRQRESKDTGAPQRLPASGAQGRRTDTEPLSGAAGSGSRGVDGRGHATSAGVFNPYAGAMRPARSPGASSEAATARTESRRLNGAARSRESRGRARGGEVSGVLDE